MCSHSDSQQSDNHFTFYLSMRRNILLFVSLLAVAFSLSSCFNILESHTTPQMLFGNVYVNPQFSGDTLVSAKDTLYDNYDQELGISRLDTMQLGDTMMFTALFSSDMNNLVSVNATYDTTCVSVWFGVDMEDEKTKKALKAESNPARGLLLFNPMYNTVSFPIYVAPQSTGSHAVKITVMSDSKYPTNSAAFILPVK